MQDAAWSPHQVRRALKDARREDHRFEGGILGSMCTAPHEIAGDVVHQFLDTNLGDPGHFPGTARLEREALDDLLALLHAPAGAAARFLSGGTEANLLAMYIARERSGRKTVVLPDTAHFSFEKAARMLGMRLRRVRTVAGRADPDAMAKAISKQTALVVGIAGTTELGLVDPIKDLSDMALDADLPLHVDAAFGGYILPFMRDASRRATPFDFSLGGVWSVGMDPHKFGMAPIPAGVLAMRDGTEWDHIAVETPYVSTRRQSSVLGTRPGAPVAATWAVHRSLGRTGYASVVETCLDNAAYLAAKLVEHGHRLVAQPELTVVTFEADDPEAVAARLEQAGLRVNIVPRYSALRIVVNPHVDRHMIDRLLDAMGEA